MRASEHTGRTAAGGRQRAEPRVGLGAVEELVGRAAGLDLRAPELAVVLGERAASLAEAAGANELWVRAESLVVHARVRLGHRASMVSRVVAALRAAEDAGADVLAARLRTDLAVAARSVGAPLVGLSALRPVLTVSGMPAIDRATALCHLVGCLGTLARRAELDRVLAQADKLVSGDGDLSGDDKLLIRALIRVSTSAHRRRHGDLVGAADAARTGIGFLDDLEDKGADGGLARVRLVLELVCALLDRGESEAALEVAEPVLMEPVRAAGVAPAGWLRLAIATRAHLPSGSAAAAARMLRDAVHSADRHGLHALSARLWLELAHVEEQIGVPGEAISCLHRARACEHVHGRARSQARALLAGEFGSGEQSSVDLAEVVAAASREPAPAAATPPRSTAAPPDRTRPMLRLAPLAVVETEQVTDTGADEFVTESAGTDGEAAETVVPPVESPVASLPAEPELSEPMRQGRRTRHDSEHGSVAARSVLDRLGISPGGSGGRRRAADGEERHPEASAIPGEPAPRANGAPPDGPAPSEEPATPPVTAEDYPGLPRLRLPPSLGPLESDDAETTASPGQSDGSEPTGPSDFDEPPADAGLAELLVRALAEHQAGTSSASALVKKLGVDDEPRDPGTPPRINGRHRDH